MDPESRDAINDGGRFLLGKDRKFEGVEGVAAIGHSVKMFAVRLEVERLAEMIAATMQTVLAPQLVEAVARQQSELEVLLQVSSSQRLHAVLEKSSQTAHFLLVSSWQGQQSHLAGQRHRTDQNFQIVLPFQHLFVPVYLTEALQELSLACLVLLH